MTQNGPTQRSNERLRPPAGGGEPSLDAVLDTAKNAAVHVKSEAVEGVASRAAAEKDKAAEGLESVAQALRGTKEELGDKVPIASDVAERAASGVEQVSSYLRSRNVGEIIDALESFGRRDPALFLGASFGLGLLAGRFMKSSKAASASRRAEEATSHRTERGDTASVAKATEPAEEAWPPRYGTSSPLSSAGPRENPGGSAGDLVDDESEDRASDPIPLSKEPYQPASPFETATPEKPAEQEAKAKNENATPPAPPRSPSTRPLSAFARAGSTPSKLPDVLAAVPADKPTADVAPSFLSLGVLGTTSTTAGAASPSTSADTDKGESEGSR